MLTQTQIDQAEYLAQLLAESELSDDLKESIINNLDKFSDEQLTKLLHALREADSATKTLDLAIQPLMQEYERAWGQLEQEQEHAAESILTQHIKNIRETKDEENLAKIRQSLE